MEFIAVASLVDAWIETLYMALYFSLYLSHPSWMRGLKPEHRDFAKAEQVVASLVDAWIETSPFSSVSVPREVASLVDAWIETYLIKASLSRFFSSHPSWMRGLKLFVKLKHSKKCAVASLVDAWIETYKGLDGC